MNIILRHVLIALSVLVVSCGSAIGNETPSDHYALAYDPEPPECSERDVIDCEGGEIGSLTITKSCVTVLNCNLGPVRIRGEFTTANQVQPSSWTREHGYPREIAEQAPWGTQIEDCTITGSTASSLYLGPGVHFTEIRRTTIAGGRTVQLYLDAETGRTVVEDCTIDATGAEREAVAIDGSARNKFFNNTIIGGVRLYRNPGEDGRTRQRTPSLNLFVGNTCEGGAVRVGGHKWKAYGLLDDHHAEAIGSVRRNGSYPHDNEFGENSCTIELGSDAFDNVVEP